MPPADLVQAVIAVHHQHMLGPEALEHLGHQRYQRRIIDPQHLTGGAGRIGQRAENVEHGTHTHSRRGPITCFMAA